MIDDDEQIGQELCRLANGVPAPQVDPAEDLRRGRLRRTRRRVVAGGAAMCLALLAVSGIALSNGATPSTAHDDDYAGPSASIDASTTGAPPTDKPRTVASTVAVTPSQAFPGHDYAPNLTQASTTKLAVLAYLDVLARHLDPDRAHLSTGTARVADDTSELDSQGDLVGLGAKFDWRNPDESGIGMLQVVVTAGSPPDWECGLPQTTWTCRDATVAGAVQAEVATYGQVTAVLVQRANGQVVTLTADPLLVNGSPVPISGFGLSSEQLLQAAADSGLSLPGDPVAPPLLVPSTFEEVAHEVLLGPGETIGEQSGDARPAYRGDWVVDGQERGRLAYAATALHGGAGAIDAGCPASQFARCELVTTTAGDRVLVGHEKASLGGGVQVVFEGPVYEVTVTAADPDFPVARAITFVTDARWQPTGTR